MKKLKYLPSFIMLILCLSVLGIGVYSATTGSNTITGKLTVNASGYEVEIAVYEGTDSTSGLPIGTNMYGTQIGSTVTSRFGRTISLSSVAFNSDKVNNLEEVDTIDIIVTVTNKSNNDIGMYFWNGTTISDDQVELENILYGHQDLFGASQNQEEDDPLVDAEYSFYHQVPARSGNTTYTEYMHVYLTLNELTTDGDTVPLTMTLNIEEYVATHDDEVALSPDTFTPADASGFVKIDSSLATVPAFGSNTAANANTDITHVVVPYGVEISREYAFANCTGLEYVSLPVSLSAIGNYAFKGCTNLTSIEIPDKSIRFGDYVFCDCSSLTSVNIPSGIVSFSRGVGSIAPYMFNGCPITSVVIPEGVTEISQGVFNGCHELTEITIPSTLRYSLDWAFGYCDSLDKVNICDLDAWCRISFSSGFGRSNPLEFAQHLCLNGEILTDITIPSTVTEIKAKAFYGFLDLTSISIPDTVLTIGSTAFYGCTNLSSVTLSYGLTTIGSSAFGSCGFSSITIPDSVTTISASAFSGCSGLSSIFIPSSVTTISATGTTSSPFYRCSSTLVINCEASEKPSGWSSYWNYYSTTNRLTTNWGQTR